MSLLKRKLSAHALLAVVVLSFIICMMLSAVILLAYSRNTETMVYRSYIKAYRNIRSSQEFFLANDRAGGAEGALDLFGLGDDSVYVHKMPWGIWNVASFSAPTIQNKRVEKSMLYGCLPQKEFKSALWMPAVSYGIGLTGSAQIKGDCYIAQGGIRTNFYEAGISSTVDKHLVGTSRPCPVADISESPSRTRYFTNLLAKRWESIYPSSQTLVRIPSDTVNRLFSESTLCIRMDSTPINLSAAFLKGNVILYSRNTIYIPAAARLEQVQVIAPVVIIESGFRGSIHVLASDSIVLQNRVQLEYPSSLVLHVERIDASDVHITVGSQSRVSGIIYSNQSMPDMPRSLITIEKDALTYGQIYTNGYVQLNGKHIGNITTIGFKYFFNGQIYRDILPEGIIDYTSMSKHFVLPLLTETNTPLQPACWIE